MIFAIPFTMASPGLLVSFFTIVIGFFTWYFIVLIFFQAPRSWQKCEEIYQNEKRWIEVRSGFNQANTQIERDIAAMPPRVFAKYVYQHYLDHWPYDFNRVDLAQRKFHLLNDIQFTTEIVNEPITKTIGQNVRFDSVGADLLSSPTGTHEKVTYEDQEVSPPTTQIGDG